MKKNKKLFFEDWNPFQDFYLKVSEPFGGGYVPPAEKPSEQKQTNTNTANADEELPIQNADEELPIQGPSSGWRSCPDNMLKIGCRGDNVKKLQEIIINKLNIPIPHGGADGKFGKFTKIAVKKMQEMIGLTGSQVDGIYGDITKQKLENYKGKTQSGTGDRAQPSKSDVTKSGAGCKDKDQAEKYYSLSQKTTRSDLKSMYLKRALELCPEEKYAQELEKVTPSTQTTNTEKVPSDSSSQTSPSANKDTKQDKITFLEAFRAIEKATDSRYTDRIVYFLFKERGFTLREALEKTLTAWKLRPIDMTGGGWRRQKPYENYLSKELRMTAGQFERLMDGPAPTPTEEDYRRNGEKLEESKLQEHYYIQPIKNRYNQVEKLVFERLVKGCK